MPYARHPLPGTVVPNPTVPGEHYVWPTGGEIVEVDPQTAAALHRMEGFEVLHDGHPDVAGRPELASVRSASPVTEAPTEAESANPDDESDADEPEDDAHAGDSERPRRRSGSKRRTVRE